MSDEKSSEAGKSEKEVEKEPTIKDLEAPEKKASDVKGGAKLSDLLIT